MLPTLELAYIFQGIAHAPRGVIVRRMLPEVDNALQQLGVFDEVVEAEGAGASTSKTNEKEWKKREKAFGDKNGKGFWDDYCLSMFLRGVCMRYIAYPVSLLCPLARTFSSHFESFYIGSGRRAGRGG